jgi:hypothetical protein
VAEQLGVVGLSVGRAAGYDEMEQAICSASARNWRSMFAGRRACPDAGDVIEIPASAMRPTPLAPQIRCGSQAAILLGAAWWMAVLSKAMGYDRTIGHQFHRETGSEAGVQVFL